MSQKDNENNENQKGEAPKSQQQPSKSLKKSAQQNCCSCFDIIPINHTLSTGIQCAQGHAFCLDCSDGFVNMVMGSLTEASFPPKCPICKINLNLSIFERNLRSQSHRDKFLTISLMKSYALGENEFWVQCKHCTYKEIRNTKNPPALVYCRNEDCKCISCYYCFDRIDEYEIDEYQGRIFEENEDDDEEEEEINEENHRFVIPNQRRNTNNTNQNENNANQNENNTNQNENNTNQRENNQNNDDDDDEEQIIGRKRERGELEEEDDDSDEDVVIIQQPKRKKRKLFKYIDDNVGKHITCCSQLGPLKHEVEKIIAESSTRKCPHCGVRGRKDDNCTHMSCICGTSWCYVCEQDERTVDKDETNDQQTPLYGHNVNWFSNKKRCPMYLSAVRDVDNEWPVSDDQCLTYFHTLITLKNLKKFVMEKGMTKVKDLLRVFPQVFGGHSLTEIITADVNKPLINKDENNENEYSYDIED